MPQDRAPVDRSLLVEQSPWITRLARNLVRDPTGAEDVVQETFLAALAAPPRDAADERRLRAWLGRVAFNLANLNVRRNVRRRDREEVAARRERQTSAADTVIRSSVLADLGEAVDGLAEPYRTAVELRYFEGLSTAEIARQTQASESAVRKRLWRARGQLRQTLDTRHNGERTAWFSALAPLAGLAGREATEAAGEGAATSTGSGASTGFGWLSSTGLQAAGLAACAVGAAMWGTLARPGAGELAFAAGEEARARDLALVAPALDTAARTPLEAPRDAAEPAHSGARAPRSQEAPAESGATAAGEGATTHGSTQGTVVRLVGSAVDLWGNPLGGLAVVNAGAPELVLGHTAPNGSFELTVPELPVSLRLAATRLVSVRDVRIEPGEQAWPALLIAAPAVTLGGQVIDPQGRGVRGARLEVVVNDEAFLEFPEPVDLAGFTPRDRVVSEAGEFRFPCVPTGPGIRLRTRAPGFLPDERPVPELDDRELRVTLRPAPPVASVWSGVVLDRLQRPIPGARVSLGGRDARTDLAGRFELPELAIDAEGAPDGRHDEAPGSLEGDLVVRKDGFPPRTLRIQGAPGPSAERDLTVVLDGVVEPVDGRILDDEVDESGDASRRDWVVFVTLDDERELDSEPDEELDGEERTAGRQSLRVDPGARDRRGALANPYDFGVPVDPQRGTFRFWGAAGRTYRVLALERRSLTATHATHVRAGGTRGLELVELVPIAPEEGSRELRLVDPMGSSLSGARVASLLELRSEGQRLTVAMASATSDPAGWLRLAGGGPGSLANTLELEHPRLGRVRTPLVHGDEPESTLSVEPARGLRLREFHGADAFRVLDVDGRAVALRGPTGTARTATLYGGRSPVHSFLAAPKGSASVVWLRGGVELGRQPIETVPGAVVEVWPEPTSGSSSGTSSGRSMGPEGAGPAASRLP